MSFLDYKLLNSAVTWGFYFICLMKNSGAVFYFIIHDSITSLVDWATWEIPFLMIFVSFF
ncbi:hypothetical protein M2347_003513 [Chryseobacterium sp. H1D6B]|nr:hypothetical protein [Chryseobacterium sp. H1D6B]